MRDFNNMSFKKAVHTFLADLSAHGWLQAGKVISGLLGFAVRNGKGSVIKGVGALWVTV
jgi:hypothetical protein